MIKLEITTPLMVALFLGIVVSQSLAASHEAAFKESSESKKAPATDTKNNTIKSESLEPITIGLIGDSTVASTYGWGPGFADRIRKEGTVHNFAKNGATLHSLSKSLDSLLKKKPDYVLIQFGHNDMKRYGTEDYSDKLQNYVERIRKAGAQPVILSSVARRSMASDGKIVHHAIKGGDFRRTVRRQGHSLVKWGCLSWTCSISVSSNTTAWDPRLFRPIIL
jgi:hypothetical protein